MVTGNHMIRYRVAYYVEKERYWQFAGEFDTLAQAKERAAFLRRDTALTVRTSISRIVRS